MNRVTDHRTSGVLLHPTSFPGGPVGTLGHAADRWIAWLAEAGQGLWQVLPLVATDEGGSPYNGLSAMAGNTLLLDGERLAAEGWISAAESAADTVHADFAAAAAHSDRLVRAARVMLQRSPERRARFDTYRQRESYWLEDYALFRALRELHPGQGWLAWPEPLRRRDPAVLEEARVRLADAIERHALGQFLFEVQWSAVHARASAEGIRVIGDIPIFVAHDSADVWAHPELFLLDAEGRSTVVSGVPPDYFSATGQLWGNPLYDWEAMRRDGYRWWSERFRRTLGMVDLARIDHFRGFESYWEVPAGEATAMNGRWVPGPGEELFRRVAEMLGALPLIAEDLGIITPEVDRLRDELGLPGMRVLQFAFGDDEANPHLPVNHPTHAVAYTGTHDNDTALGWWRGGASEQERGWLRRLTDAEEVNWGMMETVLRSQAGFAVVPLQDVLGQGSEGRMNVPGVAEGNWTWRYRQDELTPELARRLRDITRATGRTPWTARTHP